MSAKMYVNIIHRVGAANVEPFMKQQNICHKYGVKTTMMITADGFYNEETVKILKSENEKYGDEIALSFHEIDEETQREFEVKEPMIWLMEFETRKKVIVKYMEKFNELFGFYPESVSSYVWDARSLNFIHEKYPSVKATITNCFEEGVKMFYGNQNMWHLFSDGGPWGSYYPSKYNSLVPAADEAEFCGIVGLPHLNRDMIMSFTSRDDLFSSHPINVVRAKAYDPVTGDCPYMFDFIDMWLEQLKYNEYGYYNIFVAPQWLTDRTMLDETGSYAERLYDENTEYIAKKAAEGKIELMTMGEFGKWYMENIEIGTPEVNSWRDIICGSDRTMYWYIDPMMRVSFDGNIGGAICDLRPYPGRINKDTGPDTESLCNMNQPYLISAEMRGGVHDGSLHTLKVFINSKEYCIALKRTGFEVKGNKEIHILPIEITLDGISVTFDSIIEFDGFGGMTITRRLLDVSDENAVIEFMEYNRTCYGDTQYQGNMNGCSLSIENETDKQEMDFCYSSREMTASDVKKLTASYPQIGTAVEIDVLSENTEGIASDGYLFKPFITLSAKKTMKKGEELKICMKIKQAD